MSNGCECSTSSPQVLLAQIAERLNNGLRLVVAIEQTAMGEEVGLGVGEVDPLDAADRWFAQSQGGKGGGPFGLGFRTEAALPAAGRYAQIGGGARVRLGR